MNRRSLILGAVLSLVACGAGAACVANVPASTPSSEFTPNPDGTVTHQKTGLMWMGCALGQSWDGSTCSGSAAGYTWQQALQAAKALNDTGGYAGRTDWRVPNIKELRSIVERQCVSPSINSDVFPNTPASSFWSASALAGYSGGAWIVYFYGGYVDYDSIRATAFRPASCAPDSDWRLSSVGNRLQAVTTKDRCGGTRRSLAGRKSLAVGIASKKTRRCAGRCNPSRSPMR